MKGKRRRKLHETPPEFAEAQKAQAAREEREKKIHSWSEWEAEQKREKIRNMKMPSHTPPSLRCKCAGPWQPIYFQSEAAYQRRYKKWAKRFLKKGPHDSSSSTT